MATIIRTKRTATELVIVGRDDEGTFRQVSYSVGIEDPGDAVPTQDECMALLNGKTPRSLTRRAKKARELCEPKAPPKADETDPGDGGEGEEDAASPSPDSAGDSGDEGDE